MKIKLKPILDMMMDDLSYTRNHPFKIKLKHSQPHNQGKVKRQGLQSHLGQPVVCSIFFVSFHLFSRRRGIFGGGGPWSLNFRPIKGQMPGQNGQKLAYIIK